jgi:hypothetical protein
MPDGFLATCARRTPLGDPGRHDTSDSAFCQLSCLVRSRGTDFPSLGDAPEPSREDGLDVGELAKANADTLGRALAARRLDLSGIAEDDERDRRADALSLVEEYTALLRVPAVHAAVRNPVRYCFKLVVPDCRWSIGEKILTSAPSEGDVVVFDGYGDWRIQGLERVGAKPPGKRSREFFVCAPAA